MNGFRGFILLVGLFACLPALAFVAPERTEDPRILVPKRAEADARPMDPQEASEAGIDDFVVLDRDQGCLGCAVPVGTVGTIRAERSGYDVLLDWSADPAPGSRFAI